MRQRPRRLRSTPAMRRLVAQTSLEPRHLVLPMFVADGIDEPAPIASMPGVVQHTRDSLRSAAADAVTAGVGGLMLFGVPRDEDKDAAGSAGSDPDGILNVALRDLQQGPRRRDRADGRHLPRRVHRPRPLRRARRARPGRQRRHPEALRGTRCGASGFRRPRGRPERHDGRPGGGRSATASTPPATPTSSSSPTRPSSRRRSTARSGKR